MEYDAAFWGCLDQFLEQSAVVIDRPKGTPHPRYNNLIYPVDYGYLQGTSAMDGGGIDVWLGTDAGQQIDAIMCTVDMKKKDAEMKILIGCTEEEKQVIYLMHNDLPYMKGVLVRRDR